MHTTSAKYQLVEADPNALVLTCQGVLSWEDRDMLALEVQQVLQQRPDLHGLVADLAAVEFANSAGLGALFQLNRRLRDCGARLVFASVPPQLVRVFRAVGLDRLAQMQPDVNAALASLAQPDENTAPEDVAPISSPPM